MYYLTQRFPSLYSLQFSVVYQGYVTLFTQNEVPLLYFVSICAGDRGYPI